MAWTDLVSEMASTIVDPDVGVSVSVTVRKRLSLSYSFSTMSEATTASTSQTISAVRGRSRSVMGEDGKARALVRTYTVKASDLSFTPDADDLVIDGTHEHNVIRVEPIASDAMIAIEVERPL